MRRRPERNLEIINNFILHLTHCGLYDICFKELQEWTPEDMYRVAKEYVSEDHVDGYDTDEEICIQLWLDAEEANRNDKCDEADRLKVAFSKRYEQDWVDKQYIDDYLESVGG